MANNVPAGWHSDPTVPGGQRWWDGEKWTDHTHPPPPAAQPPATQPQASMPSPPAANINSQAQDTAAPRRNKRTAYLVGGGVLVLLIALAQVANDDDATPLPQANEVATPEAATEEQGVTTTTATEDQTESMVVTELLESPDETGFLDGVRIREPLVAETLDRETLINFGQRSCRMRNGYIMGSRPTPTETLVADISGEVRTLDLDDVASAVANAAQSTLCDVTVVEAP